MSEIVHKDTMQIDASPDQVLAFVRDPKRIADYFPKFIDCGTFVEGKSYWCLGKSGYSLLETVESECSDNKVTIVVYSANPKTACTAQDIKDNAFMTMFEDWEVKAQGDGTELQKTWRDVECFGLMRWIPMNSLIRSTARNERTQLIECWNQAAKLETA